MVTDVIIIGAGASGLAASVYLKNKNPSLSVRLFEAMPRVGKKLSLTGNGRCNITNKKIELSRYHGENVEFCEYALSKYDRSFCEEFFYNIGVPFTYEGDKGYPLSLQAASVVDCLRFAADNAGVITYLETKVTNIQISGEYYKIIAGNLSFLAKNIIVATGLYSGGERMGCDGIMLSVLKKAGYRVVKVSPSLVQVKTETDIVKQLKGIKVDALATLKVSGKSFRSEMGEVLFCDYGLSGPPILQISRQIGRNDEPCDIVLDLFPDIDFNALTMMLIKRAKLLSSRSFDEFFTGMLNKRLGQVVLKLADLKLSDTVDSLTEQKAKKVASILKNFTFKVTGTTGYTNSQVSAGGLDTNQFSNKTMMCKNAAGFYCIGEILDIDGDCGGFNLQWAWSSAFCAADAILGDQNDYNK